MSQYMYIFNYFNNHLLCKQIIESSALHASACLQQHKKTNFHCRMVL